MLDVRKLFDTLCPALVARLGADAGLPPWLIRCAVQSYSWPRHLKCGEIISEPVIPSFGVVAGDDSAMFMVTAVMGQTMAAFDRQITGLSQRQHVVGLAANVGKKMIRLIIAWAWR